MTGIEVLVAQEVATKFTFNWSAFWITFGIIFGIALFVGIITSFLSDDWSNSLCGVFAGIIIGLFFGAMVGDVMLHTPTAYETQYKVTVSDEVPINEFLEKYEIIEQEGKIYTIRERNQEDFQ